MCHDHKFKGDQEVFAPKRHVLGIECPLWQQSFTFWNSQKVRCLAVKLHKNFQMKSTTTAVKLK